MIFTFLFLFLGLAANNAQAEEFYVELGRANTEAEAKTAWDTLKSANKALAEYDVFPNKIVQFDGSFIYRVQAGPMIDKREASRVCRKLFAKKIPCYVIEGFDPKNTQTFANPNAPNIPAPAPVAEKEPDLIFPWLSSLAPTPAPPSSEGKVEVAEAIAVPLTDTDSNEVTVVGAPAPVAAAPSVETNSSIFSLFKHPGWLSVQPFLDEARAQKFWKKLQRQVPDATAKLSAQMIHPVVSQDIPKVILSIGSFESEEVATAFCNSYITSSPELECHFSSEPPQGETAASKRAEKVATDEYSLFWIDLMGEKNQDKLLEKWERIRTDNDDLLVDTRSQITTSLAEPGMYVVRIGPLKTRSKATRLCGALQSRGLGCKLVSL